MLYHCKQVYFNKDIIILIKRYISILNDINDNTDNFLSSKSFDDDDLNEEWVIEQIDILEEIYFEIIKITNIKYLV